ncbi:hypothetical protein [Stutzerimonas xanthomarina]|uniref:hypothetical protein n=1 Tax=Stutzerimonas xanthomarina TaxID=271420 RepID=UPI0029B1D774|nr:hypothetical protein [Stutzerimonas xanthomarina]MDX2354908.1 hypothetical protein [Stutzerimonas xanthomarina]
MSTADVRARNRFQRLWSQISERYEGLLPHQKAYVNAVVSFAIYWLLKPLEWEINQVFFAFAVCSWAMAVASDLLAFYKKFAESTLGRLLLVVTVGFGTNAAIAMAAQVVNDLVGIDPSRFTHTIAFVSMYSGLTLVFVAMSVLFVLGMGLVFLYLILNWTNDEKTISVLIPWYRPAELIPYKRLTATFQVTSFLILCGLAYSSVKNDQVRYTNFVKNSAEWFLYNVEMYQKAPCALGADQRVAFLDNGQVLIASKAGERITFAVQACVAEG